MTIESLRKLAAGQGITGNREYVKWLEERAVLHANEMERRVPPPEWPQWDREQYAELCEHAEEWLRGAPSKLPWSIETRVSMATQVIIKNAEWQAVVWRGMDNGSYTSPLMGEYILRAVNYFPMALWAVIQHNNDAAAYWEYAEKLRSDSSREVEG